MTAVRRHVLVVDRDRIAGLISKMLVREYSTDVVSDGIKAVDKLRKLLPSVLVVDAEIPGNGIALTELVGISPKFHSIPVILTSANPSSQMVIKARNAGAQSYLAKPFGPTELHRRIGTVLSNVPAEKKGVIQDRVKKIENLPAFPAAHAEILKLARNVETTSDEMAEKIQLDPSLLATVFKLVNSTYYGFQEKVDSLNLAVTLLGLREIANLVMSAQVFKILGTYEGGGLDLQEFWKHSVGTAFIVRTLARKYKIDAGVAFLAGMLHDLGKVVLDRCFSDYYRPVLKKARVEGTPLANVEQDVLGLNHADVGGQLAMEWKFGDHLLDCIRHHHSPSKAQCDKRLVCLVHLADVICRQLKFGSDTDTVVPEVDEQALRQLSLGRSGVRLFAEAARTDIDNAESFLTALHN